MKFHSNSLTLALLSITAVQAIPTPGFGSSYKSAVGFFKKPSFGFKATKPAPAAAAVGAGAVAAPLAAAAPVEQIRTASAVGQGGEQEVIDWLTNGIGATNPNTVEQVVRNAPAASGSRNALMNAKSESSQSLGSVNSLDSDQVMANYFDDLERKRKGYARSDIRKLYPHLNLE